MIRIARCCCGQLRAEASADSVRVVFVTVRNANVGRGLPTAGRAEIRRFARGRVKTMDFGITLPAAAGSRKIVKRTEELGLTNAWFYNQASGRTQRC
jgi:hypothetical protein